MLGEGEEREVSCLPKSYQKGKVFHATKHKIPQTISTRNFLALSYFLGFTGLEK